MTIKEKKAILKILNPYSKVFSQIFYWLKIDNVEIKKDKLKSYLKLLEERGLIRLNYDAYSITSLGEKYMKESE